MSELTERLRVLLKCRCEPDTGCCEACSAIDAVDDEIERLHKLIDGAAETGEIYERRLSECEADNERLRETLEGIRMEYSGNPRYVDLIYRIDAALGTPADQPEPVVDHPWQEIVKNATRYMWLRENSPGAVCSAAWRVKAACEFSTPDEAVDAAITASKSPVS